MRQLGRVARCRHCAAATACVGLIGSCGADEERPPPVGSSGTGRTPSGAIVDASSRSLPDTGATRGGADANRDATRHAPEASDAAIPSDAGARPDASGGDAASERGIVEPPLVFTDVTTAAGIDYVQSLSTECVRISCDPEAPYMTGGAAVGDFDGDGWIDLFATRLDAPDLLYKNRGDGTFEEVAGASGLVLDRHTNGAGFADIDNDGDQDLYVTAIGDAQFYLFINDGAGSFTEEAALRGVSSEPAVLHEGTSVAFGDYDRDGFLDLYAGEWRPSSKVNGEPANARLFENQGARAPGFFTDVTVPAGLALDANHPDGVFAFAPSFTDLDDDGWPDLAIAADFGTSRLFWNDGNGTFTDGTAAAGVGTDENGMGSAIGDYDGDGRLDWFVTSIYDPLDSCATGDCSWGKSGNRLYRNEGGRTFSDRTDEAGVRVGFWGWGSSFFDYDNDGDLDLVMTNGIDFLRQTDDHFRDDPLRLWRNDGGVMTEVSSQLGIEDTDNGKGLLVFDYDGDGDLDLFAVNHGAPPRLYRNDGGNRNGWLRLRLVGTSSNRDGVGARVWVRRMLGEAPLVRELRSGSNFLGQNEPILHFGLGPGSDPVAEVRIRWPRTGAEQVLTDVSRNQTLEVVEPRGDGGTDGG